MYKYGPKITELEFQLFRYFKKNRKKKDIFISFCEEFCRHKKYRNIVDGSRDGSWMALCKKSRRPLEIRILSKKFWCLLWYLHDKKFLETSVGKNQKRQKYKNPGIPGKKSVLVNIKMLSVNIHWNLFRQWKVHWILKRLGSNPLKFPTSVLFPKCFFLSKFLYLLATWPNLHKSTTIRTQKWN